MSTSKKIDMYRDFAAGVFLSEAQTPIHYIRLYFKGLLCFQSTKFVSMQGDSNSDPAEKEI